MISIDVKARTRNAAVSDGVREIVIRASDDKEMGTLLSLWGHLYVMGPDGVVQALEKLSRVVQAMEPTNATE